MPRTMPACVWLAWACVPWLACSSEHVESPPPAAPEPQLTAAGAGAPAPPEAAPPEAAPPPATAPPPTAAQPPTLPPMAASDDALYLGLHAPEQGFRLATRGREIAPGSDVEFCEVAVVPGPPGEPYHVDAVELANADGSHHLIVEMAAPGSAAERSLRQLEPGTQVPCIGAAQEFAPQGMSVLASTQTRHVRSELPPGIAQRVFGGQRLVFDYHYFNFGSQPLTARSALAARVLSGAAPVTLVSSLAFTNMTIDTPPKSEQSFSAVCTLKHDAMLYDLARHTHRFGTQFSVWFEGGARHGQHIWTSQDWEHELEYRFAQPLLVKAGEGFKFTCAFRNEGTGPLRFGISSRDEMCILAAAIWSPTPQAELAPEECVITWIDAQGIGRDADDAGGFPAAAAADAPACHAGSLGLSLLSSCVGCMCDRCGTIMARCSADADCKALLDCSTGCMDQGTQVCQQQCEPVMFAHSSAVGMISQVGECIRAGCGEACALSPAGMP